MYTHSLKNSITEQLRTERLCKKVVAMAMSASAIRFNDEEKEWITAFAEMNGTTFSAQVRNWTLERLEDEMDARELKIAMETDMDKPLSWEQAKKELF